MRKRKNNVEGKEKEHTHMTHIHTHTHTARACKPLQKPEFLADPSMEARLADFKKRLHYCARHTQQYSASVKKGLAAKVADKEKLVRRHAAAPSLLLRFSGDCHCVIRPLCLG